MIVRLVCRAEKTYPLRGTPRAVPAGDVDEFLNDKIVIFKRNMMESMLTRLQRHGVVAVFDCRWVFEILEDGG